LRLVESGEPATVQSSEYFGADTILACRVGNQLLQMRVPGRPGLADGAAVHLAWDPMATHFFDRSSGARRDDVTRLNSF
jgi:sn-glycerol 3-phosphate transport system ATP-binding protein